MTRVRVEGVTVSLDGYGAGPNLDIDNPLGVGAAELHRWLIPTRTFQRALFGEGGGTCSAPLVDTGRTRTGKVGGEKIHPTIEMEGGTTFRRRSADVHARSWHTILTCSNTQSGAV